MMMNHNGPQLLLYKLGKNLI